jgi:predicted nucleic acid-binding protein
MPETGSVLLDTSIVVAHLRGIQPVTLKLEQFDTLFLPMVALGELLAMSISTALPG